jgi:D-threo-aldose 1-dehydrogenase
VTSADRKRWPRVGLGCAALGAPPPGLADSTAVAVIEAAIVHGIRFFDVAPLYGGGLAEERLGRALAGLPRDDYVLCTKTGVTRPYAEPPLPKGATRRRAHDVWDYSASATRASIERSLRRLGVDRLDVVHLHDAEDHLDRCLDAHRELARLREQGVVGAIGIGSNLVAPVEHLLARAPFDAFLIAGCYTLLDQSARTLIDAAHARGIRVVAGGVFNSGILARWPHPAPTFAYSPADEATLARTARIAAICAAHRVPIAAAALQFVIANPAIDTVLLGPRNLVELDANLGALHAPIPDALWSALEDEALVPRGSPRPSRLAANALA